MRRLASFALTASLLSMTACQVHFLGGGGDEGDAATTVHAGAGGGPITGGGDGSGGPSLPPGCMFPYACPSSVGGVTVPVPPSMVAAGGKAEITILPERDCNWSTYTILPSTSLQIVPPGTSSLTVPLDDHSSASVVFFGSDGALVDGAIWSPASAVGPAVDTGNLLEVPSQYPTIQAAVAAASPGDTVHVAPGTYTEQVVLAPGVRLLGAGADQTTLDAQGQSVVLVTASWGSVVRGFRFVNVGSSLNCSQPGDPFACGASAYPAAVAVTGAQDPFCDRVGTALVADNVFEDDQLAVMFAFHAYGIVRNNLFVNNHVGFAGITGADEHVVIRENVFDENDIAVAGDAAFLHIAHNVIAHSGVGYRRAHVQLGEVRCNAFRGNELDSGLGFDAVPFVAMGADGNTLWSNVTVLDSALTDCFPAGIDPTTISWGSFAGAFGEAYEAGLL